MAEPQNQSRIRAIDFAIVEKIVYVSMACKAIGVGLLVADLARGGTLRAATTLPMALGLNALLLDAVAFMMVRRRLAARSEGYRAAREAKRQTDELFAMTDMLQSADTYEDATAVLQATAQRLLPDYGAALYVFNNSRDRLDLTGQWAMPDGHHVAETLAPSNCWALKRGKPHINDPGEATLCCAHHASRAASVEIPMMARGQVYGLLVFVTARADAFEALKDIRRLCRALADSMSLALSNIALREKLRTQSLRDPLTGLYNRRYMEDALERYVSLAERSGGATAVLMIDLDNFKHLNDEHGHAKGDAVLRDVASQLVGGLRPSDVVCRYGGEELLVILPGCGIDDAALKAETLRVRIAGLSEVHQTAISASFGVAAIPEAAVGPGELIAIADGALYRAKAGGKNRVVLADRRVGREEAGPRLAAMK